MLLKNTADHFGLITKLLHWGMALLIIGLLILGLYMVTVPIGLWKLKLYGWHKPLGFLVLALACFRLLWRLSNENPQLAIPWLEALAARGVHWLFYGFMFALPITGWLLTSAAGLSTSFFGLFTIPIIIAPDKQSLLLFTWMHKWLSYGLIATLILHTSAALKHHFIDKDDILKRMIT